MGWKVRPIVIGLFSVAFYPVALQLGNFYILYHTSTFFYFSSLINLVHSPPVSNVVFPSRLLQFVASMLIEFTQTSVYVNRIYGTTHVVKFSTWWDGRIIWHVLLSYSCHGHLARWNLVCHFSFINFLVRFMTFETLKHQNSKCHNHQVKFIQDNCWTPLPWYNWST